MIWEEFMKGITVLYAFGLQEKDEWELKIWFKALRCEMSADQFEGACMAMARDNVKFWQTDNIPAQLIDSRDKLQVLSNNRLIEQRKEDEQERRVRERREAVESYDSEEDRLKCIEDFKQMNRKTFRSMPS